MNVLDTRATLLLRIRNMQDRGAWSEFVALYTPLLYAYAVKRGFQDADAADVAQDAMCDVIRAIQSFHYDVSKGSFRGWLLTVLLNQIRKKREKQQRNATHSEACVDEVMDQRSQANEQARWEREYQLHLFHWAARQVQKEFREQTWNAFWMTTVENQPVEQVAANLEITVGAIYIARSRVLNRIRTEVSKIEQREFGNG